MYEFRGIAVETNFIEIENNDLIIGEEVYPLTNYTGVNRDNPEKMEIRFKDETEDGDKTVYDTIVAEGTAAENEALWKRIENEIFS